MDKGPINKLSGILNYRFHVGLRGQDNNIQATSDLVRKAMEKGDYICIEVNKKLSIFNRLNK